MPDIFDILEAENARILDTLEKLEDATADDPDLRDDLLSDAEEWLARQREIEEERLYPHLDRDDRTQALVETSRDTWERLDELLEDLDGIDAAAAEFQPKAETVLGTFRQLREHETKQLFPQAREALPAGQAQTITDGVLADYPELTPGSTAERAAATR